MITWGPILTALISAGAALIGVGLTLFVSDRREARRMEHEQALKIREDRLQAYATLARITKIIEPSEPPKQSDVGQALSEVEMLTDKPQVLDFAARLVNATIWARTRAWDLYKAGKDLKSDPEFGDANDSLNQHRSIFVQLAKDELKGRRDKGEAPSE